MVEGECAGISGALDGMGEVNLPIVKAVILVNSSEGKILIGHASAAWDKRGE